MRRRPGKYNRPKIRRKGQTRSFSINKGKCRSLNLGGNTTTAGYFPVTGGGLVDQTDHVYVDFENNYWEM